MFNSASQFSGIYDYFDPRMYYKLISKKIGISCTWIPKNMCSTLKLSFCVAEGIISESMIPGFQRNPHWIHNWTWPVEPKSHFDLIDFPETFVVVRNPSMRLRSALVEKVCYQDDDAYRSSIFEMLNVYSLYVKKPVDEMTYADLIKLLQLTPDRLIDEHFRSQVSFLSGEYSRVFKFENSNEIQEYLVSKGMPIYTVDKHSPAGEQTFEVGLESKVNEVRSLHRSNSTALPKFDIAIENSINQLVVDRYRHDLSLWNGI